jgi:TatD DNase family protein
MTLPYLNFHTHHPAHENEFSLGGEEYGMDRRWETPLLEQEEAFRLHVTESEQEAKPLVIHCVRTLEDILRIRKEMHPRQPWIMHGFRGKPQQLQSLLSAGIYVSFGLRYNKESLLLCPLEMMFLETDDEALPIEPLYKEVAQIKGISVEVLKLKIWENANKLFPHLAFSSLIRTFAGN